MTPSGAVRGRDGPRDKAERLRFSPDSHYRWHAQRETHVDGYETVDELARDIELAIEEFDRALTRHEKARSRTPAYAETTSILGRVKDELSS